MTTVDGKRPKSGGGCRDEGSLLGGFAAGCRAHLVALADGRIVGTFGVDHGPAAVSTGAACTAVDTRGLGGDCDAELNLGLVRAP